MLTDSEKMIDTGPFLKKHRLVDLMKRRRLGRDKILVEREYGRQEE